MIITEQQVAAQYRPHSKWLPKKERDKKAYLSSTSYLILHASLAFFLQVSISNWPWGTGMTLKPIHMEIPMSRIQLTCQQQKRMKQSMGMKFSLRPVTWPAYDTPLVPTHHHFSGSCLFLPGLRSTPHSAFQPHQGNTGWQKQQLTLIFLRAGTSHNWNFFCSSQESK